MGDPIPKYLYATTPHSRRNLLSLDLGLDLARGVNKRYLPLYLAPCEFFYNRRKQTSAQQFRKLLQVITSKIGKFVKKLSTIGILKTFESVEIHTAQ